MKSRNRQAGLVLMVVAFGCATGTTTAGRQPPAGAAPTGAHGRLSQPAGADGEADSGRVPPPTGTRRLPLSLNCEPEPPCVDCLHATGNEARLIGSLDKEVVRGVIRSHIDDVKECYDAVVAIHPESKGIMRVRFGIGPSGAVETSCLVSSELNAASMDRCVVDLLLKWRFPGPEGGGWVAVTYPFTFAR